LETTRSGLLLQIEAARTQSERLFGILKPDTLFERPIALRHRVIFYLGHLDGFDSIQICRQGLGLKSPDPDLDDLFQAGIDPDSSALPQDTPADWPPLEQVQAYTERCRRRVDRNLEQAPEDLICMALEHRQMHLETLAYMFHNFAYGLKNAPAKLENSADGREAPANIWRDIPEGPAVLGKPRNDGFGWDNEYEQFATRVPGFRMQRQKVSNGEYLRFVLEGAALPHFWVKRGDAIFYRGMFAEIPLPLDRPVYVTQAEAEAYAHWMGKSLPSEEQFHRAAYGNGAPEPRAYPWGDAAPRREHGNFDFAGWNPEPVDAAPDGDSAFGVRQLIGNGWEWTRTVFAPFSGFQAHPAYPGYSANFFDGRHYVMKGASPRTAARLLRRSFRNWFRPDYPYVYAAFRCVEN
ncbi:MAG: SUMF1/EgtB/PvdO family nonheme iron enzyme, partial [Bryobacteraceae bacterium]